MPTIPIRQQILHDKPCAVCGKLFKPNTSVHYYCSPQCKGRVQYINGYGSTENQYKRISQNWRSYLLRLVYHVDRKDRINVDHLMKLLKDQDYKCALSGIEMTCILGKGMTHFTNASVDRIIPGSEYKEGNIRLVCRIANIMKWNMSDDELLTWCERVLDYNAKRS